MDKNATKFLSVYFLIFKNFRLERNYIPAAWHGCGHFRQETLIFSEIQNTNPSGPDLDGIEIRNKSKSQKSKPYISEEDIPNMNTHIVKCFSFENLFFEH